MLSFIAIAGVDRGFLNGGHRDTRERLLSIIETVQLGDE